MREQFEKLPEIAELLIEAQFDEQTGEYVSYWSYKSGYLNGAWYAFQEQQKKIDEIVGIVREADLSNGNSSVAIVHDEIQELLK